MEHDSCLKRKSMFEENEHKVCTNVWECCAKALKEKIEARSDSESMACIKPINLLKSIKEYSLSYEEDCYEIAAIVDAFKDCF